MYGGLTRKDAVLEEEKRDDRRTAGGQVAELYVLYMYIHRPSLRECVCRLAPGGGPEWYCSILWGCLLYSGCRREPWEILGTLRVRSPT